MFCREKQLNCKNPLLNCKIYSQIFIISDQILTRVLTKEMYNRFHSNHVTLMTFHKALLPYFWSIVIDIAIFLPFLVQYKYTTIIHMVLGGIVAVTSIVTSWESMMRGLPPLSLSKNESLSSIIIKINVYKNDTSFQHFRIVSLDFCVIEGLELVCTFINSLE